jgi:hypothetical protein
MMRRIVTITAVCFMLVGCVSRQVKNEPISDLAILLTKLDNICGDRWYINVDADHILLRSKETLSGGFLVGNFTKNQTNNYLRFEYSIVKAVDSRTVIQRQERLTDLRKQARRIEHKAVKGYWYVPKNEEEWELVLLVRKAEKDVDDIPDLKFRSAYLSTRYAMKFFRPDENNQIAVQYGKDIADIYKLFEVITPSQIPDSCADQE